MYFTNMSFPECFKIVLIISLTYKSDAVLWNGFRSIRIGNFLIWQRPFALWSNKKHCRSLFMRAVTLNCTNKYAQWFLWVWLKKSRGIFVIHASHFGRDWLTPLCENDTDLRQQTQHRWKISHYRRRLQKASITQVLIIHHVCSKSCKESCKISYIATKANIPGHVGGIRF